MGELEPEQARSNVNVTLGTANDPRDVFADKEFPCPLCGCGLPILTSKRNKPYLTCNFCGVQIFVRGKTGISRLAEMAKLGILVADSKESAAHGIRLFNRLEQLKKQRDELKWKQGIFFKDENVENTIQVVDAEIKKVEGELAKIAGKTERETKK
jgi:DNA-directed RNA polymerase subunit RPC12/RpoP